MKKFRCSHCGKEFRAGALGKTCPSCQDGWLVAA